MNRAKALEQATVTIEKPVSYEYRSEETNSKKSDGISDLKSSNIDFFRASSSNLVEETMKVLDELSQEYMTEDPNNSIAELEQNIDGVVPMEMKTTSDIDIDIPVDDNGDNIVSSNNYLVLWKTSQDIRLTALIFMILLTVKIIHGLAVSYTDRVFNSPFAVRSELSDIIVRRALPWFQKSGISPDIDRITVVFCFSLIICRLILFRKECFRIARRLMMIFGFGYLLRAFLIVFTLLPSPNPDCRSYPLEGSFADAIILSFNGRNTCGDASVSGSSFLFMICMMLWYFKPLDISNQIAAITTQSIVLCFCVFGTVMHVISGNSYTVGAIFGIIMAVSLWTICWTLIEISEFRYSRGIFGLLGRIDVSEESEVAPIKRNIC